MKEGIGSIFNISTPNGLASNLKSGDQIFPARVHYTLLEDDQDKIQEMNVPAGSIGVIQCKRIFNGYEDESDSFIVAYPLNSYRSFYPIKNETVIIMATISNSASGGKDNTSVTYRYIDVLGLWDSIEHNAIPENRKPIQEDPNSSYSNTLTGFSKKSQPKTDEKTISYIDSGKIKKLKHLPGDHIIEGRFGNSIRFGNSLSGYEKSPFRGPSGSPLTIIRNGQREISEDKFSAAYEDINKDGGIIAFFSEQTIDFIPGNDNFDTYNKTITQIQRNSIVSTSPVASSTGTPLSQQDTATISSTPQVEQKSEQKPTNQTASNTTVEGDEIGFIPDNEADYQYTKEFEDVIVGSRNSFLLPKSSLDLYIQTQYKNGNRIVSREELINRVKRGPYGTLPIYDFKITEFQVVDIVSILNYNVKNGKIQKNIARSILATAINEQGKGTKIVGFNNNIFGITTDGDKWGTGPTFPNVSFNGQVVAIGGAGNAPSNEIGKARMFASFSDVKDAIFFMNDALFRKSKPHSKEDGFAQISYSETDSEEYAKLYITKWYVVPLTKELIIEKKKGYETAKKYIP